MPGAPGDKARWPRHAWECRARVSLYQSLRLGCVPSTRWAAIVAIGAGAALIADNLISGARRGAIVGMQWKQPVTGDLSKGGAARYAQLTINGNRVR
jgi:hypothetical protein